jgi:hypothetical protein
MWIKKIEIIAEGMPWIRGVFLLFSHPLQFTYDFSKYNKSHVPNLEYIRRFVVCVLKFKF